MHDHAFVGSAGPERVTVILFVPTVRLNARYGLFAKFKPKEEAARSAVEEAESMVRSTSLIAAPPPKVTPHATGSGDGQG